ncbi:MAG: ATP-binding protein [Phascolarctobacterium sp.]|nr:ATP-binding protein [Phascolarctobacterium sp.]
MLKRKIYDTLLNWKQTKHQDCLLLRGVRQCGKTYIVQQFGQNEYQSFIEINFIERPDLQTAFSGNLSVAAMVQQINLLMPEAQFIPGKTLIFLDEIQDCPNARTSLKFWALDGRYDVIASGSLLGIDYKGITSIPVGYETQLVMHPLDFEEFLWAQGVLETTLPSLNEYKTGTIKIPDALHLGMLNQLREYLLVGGMPEVINKFLATHDYLAVHNAQKRILRDYQDDIAKYAPNSDRIKARKCFLSIPKQLSKENHKFQYSIVEKNSTARKFESSLDWLYHAGIINFAYNISGPFFPLEAYAKEDQFRVYLCDIGLLVAMYGYELKQSIIQDIFTGPAKGGIYESLVADMLIKNGQPLYYYKKDDSTLEIEFMLERQGRLVPVEVKATKGSSKSLNVVLASESIHVGYKLTSQNTGRVDKKITLPLYMTMLI